MIKGKLLSLVLAMLGGMMASSFLHAKNVVDLGFGFAPGSLGEGAAIAIIGGAGGAAVLTAFRMLSEMFGGGDREEDD